MLTAFIYNTFTYKVWILDFGTALHVCFQKEMFNSLVAKHEGTVKMADGLVCGVIGIVTVNVTSKDGTMRALEAVRYVPEARYNLMFIKVLDEEGCWIQRQQGVTVSQGDSNSGRREVWRVIQAERRNSVRGGLLGISLEMSSSRGGASRKTAIRHEPDQNVTRRRRCTFRKGSRWPSHGDKSAKGFEKGGRVKSFMVWLQSRGKNQDNTPKLKVFY